MTADSYLKDGRLEIDNNFAENSIRPTKLGMRNWLFIGNAEAGWVAAVIVHAGGEVTLKVPKLRNLP